MTQNRKFKTIAIVGKPRHDIALETHLAVYNWLKDRQYNVLVEANIAKQLNLPNAAGIAEIGEWADLVIVIGGDGNMLGIARQLAKYCVPLIGINRGNLGFLTDIARKRLLSSYTAVWSVVSFLLKIVSCLKLKSNKTAK